MARKRGPVPQPWARTVKGKKKPRWYVTLDGKQIFLSDQTKSHAAEVLRGILNAREPGSIALDKFKIRELAELWIDDVKRRLAAKTVRSYENRIKSFCESCGEVSLAAFKPHLVSKWVGSKKWSQSSVRASMSAVKIMVSWAEEQGYIDSDPIRKLKLPAMQRRAPITLKDAVLIISGVRPSIVSALRVLLTTGLRPGELCSMTVEKTDTADRKAIVKGKTGVRSITIAEVTVAILEPLMAGRSQGPVLIDQRGNGLTVHALEAAVKRARRRLAVERGLNRKALDYIKPHCFRGLFATEALRRGVDGTLVTALLGQIDPSILLKHYAAPDDQMLRNAIDRATRTADKTPDIPQEPQD